MTMRRYQPRSPLQAISPKALMGLFAEPEELKNDEIDNATVVTIRGPLAQHDDWWEDSYEAIRARVRVACDQVAPTVILRIDSPGGDVAGLFDAARGIRDDCLSAGKQLIAHVEGQCCSAAYALATAADRIVASRTAEVGSIGIIAARVDESRALENAGVTVTLITSGARKGDGWPVQPMSEEELESYQADIDGLAAEFFEAVSLRRGITTDEIEALEASTLRGQAAVDAGLVDELGSFDSVIASLGAAPAKGNPMDDIKEALRAIAEDEECSEEERERARRALAALDGEEDEGAEDGDSDEESAEDGEDDPEAEDDSDEESAEDETDEGAEDDEEDDPKAAKRGKVSAKTAGEIAAHGSKLEQRVAKLERRDAAKEKRRLIAAHGGVSKGMSKILMTKPLFEVKALLAEMPKPKKPKLGDHAATTTVGGTRGKNQNSGSQLPPDEAKAMRRAMGLEKETFGVVERGNVLLLGAPQTEGGE